MLLGVLLAYYLGPQLMSRETLTRLTAALLTTCIVASSNYVLNEFLDGPTDRLHPTKSERPAARGDVVGWITLILWGVLGFVGIEMGFRINSSFGAAAFALWVMGCVYNIPPVRSKELPYIDVLTESLNNPIRLFLGWFVLIPDRLPPLSLGLAYWMMGAFFMATKRFAELRSIPDRERLALYRRSFRFYDERGLLGSMAFYLTAGAIFGGIFIVRYKAELILGVPVYAGFFAYYVVLAMRHDSPVQRPERLYRERPSFRYAIFAVATFVGLMALSVPGLYELFGLREASLEPLWRIR